MADKDLYAILGVSRQATTDEIKHAYRKLAKQHHPDRNKGNPDSVNRFKEVQQAYDLLSDPKRRLRYDQFGITGDSPTSIPEGFWKHEGPGGAKVHQWSSNQGGFPDDFDLSDLFNAAGGARSTSGGPGSVFEGLFGRRRPSKRRTRESAPPPAADVEHEVALEFDQAIRGMTLELSMDRAGRGSVRETIEVRIPPGVADGQRVRVRGKGAVRGDHSRGDLYIVCRVRPHAHFRRDGNDIHLVLPLTLTEAALGAKVSIPTLDGPTVVTVPPGTASGKKLRLAGKGVLDARTGVRGDQYAIVKIVPPARLTARQRTLLEELGETGMDNPREGLW